MLYALARAPSRLVVWVAPPTLNYSQPTTPRWQHINLLYTVFQLAFHIKINYILLQQIHIHVVASADDFVFLFFTFATKRLN